MYFCEILSLEINFNLANNADPDEMLPYAVFQLGLHCLPEYPFAGFQNEMGLRRSLSLDKKEF